jgi:hypothetical protein
LFQDKICQLLYKLLTFNNTVLKKQPSENTSNLLDKDPDILKAPLLATQDYSIGDEIEIIFNRSIDCTPRKYYIILTLYEKRKYYDVTSVEGILYNIRCPLEFALIFFILSLKGNSVTPGLISECRNNKISVYITSLANFRGMNNRPSRLEVKQYSFFTNLFLL